jgi:uncharacterized protein YdbL (DUF1318 family)
MYKQEKPTMFKYKKYIVLMLFLLGTACVTINVYFPAAAAEHAADEIIQRVYGEDGSKPAPAEPQPQTSIVDSPANVVAAIMNLIIPAAHAQQPDINISSPAIDKATGMMEARHQSLSPYYDSGAVGMENNGLITVRDDNLIQLKDRNAVKKLVADENRDRNMLYAELASANGHPEWEDEIRDTFARRWIANAPGGWWYKDATGRWQQK